MRCVNLFLYKSEVCHTWKPYPMCRIERKKLLLIRRNGFFFQIPKCNQIKSHVLKEIMNISISWISRFGIISSFSFHLNKKKVSLVFIHDMSNDILQVSLSIRWRKRKKSEREKKNESYIDMKCMTVVNFLQYNR